MTVLDNPVPKTNLLRPDFAGFLVDHRKNEYEEKQRCIEILMRPPELRPLKELKQLVALTSHVTFLRNLPSEDYRIQLARVMTYEKLETNQAIFNQNEAGTAFYIILAGSANVYRMAQQGKRPRTSVIAVDTTETDGTNVADILGRSLVSTLKEGDSFGELALLEEGALRSATVLTTETTELLVITAREYRQVLQKLHEAEVKKRVDCFRHIPALLPATRVELLDPALVALRQTYRKGDVVLSESDALSNPNIFFVAGGQCAVERTIAHPSNPDLECHIQIAVLEKYDIFGATHLLYGDETSEAVPRATIRALTDTELITVSRYDFKKKVAQIKCKRVKEAALHVPPDHVLEDVCQKFVSWQSYRTSEADAVFRSRLPASDSGIPCLRKDCSLPRPQDTRAPVFAGVGSEEAAMRKESAREKGTARSFLARAYASKDKKASESASPQLLLEYGDYYPLESPLEESATTRAKTGDKENTMGDDTVPETVSSECSPELIDLPFKLHMPACGDSTFKPSLNKPSVPKLALHNASHKSARKLGLTATSSATSCVATLGSTRRIRRPLQGSMEVLDDTWLPSETQLRTKSLFQTFLKRRKRALLDLENEEVAKEKQEKEEREKEKERERERERQRRIPNSSRRVPKNVPSVMLESTKSESPFSRNKESGDRTPRSVPLLGLERLPNPPKLSVTSSPTPPPPLMKSHSARAPNTATHSPEQGVYQTSLRRNHSSRSTVGHSSGSVPGVRDKERVERRRVRGGERLEQGTGGSKENVRGGNITGGRSTGAKAARTPRTGAKSSTSTGQAAAPKATSPVKHDLQGKHSISSPTDASAVGASQPSPASAAQSTLLTRVSSGISMITPSTPPSTERCHRSNSLDVYRGSGISPPIRLVSKQSPSIPIRLRKAPLTTLDSPHTVVPATTSPPDSKTANESISPSPRVASPKDLKSPAVSLVRKLLFSPHDFDIDDSIATPPGATHQKKVGKKAGSSNISPNRRRTQGPTGAETPKPTPCVQVPFEKWACVADRALLRRKDPKAVVLVPDVVGVRVQLVHSTGKPLMDFFSPLSILLATSAVTFLFNRAASDYELCTTAVEEDDYFAISGLEAHGLGRDTLIRFKRTKTTQEREEVAARRASVATTASTSTLLPSHAEGDVDDAGPPRGHSSGDGLALSEGSPRGSPLAAGRRMGESSPLASGRRMGGGPGSPRIATEGKTLSPRSAGSCMDLREHGYTATDAPDFVDAGSISRSGCPRQYPMGSSLVGVDATDMGHRALGFALTCREMFFRWRAGLIEVPQGSITLQERQNLSVRIAVHRGPLCAAIHQRKYYVFATTVYGHVERITRDTIDLTPLNCISITDSVAQHLHQSLLMRPDSPNHYRLHSVEQTVTAGPYPAAPQTSNSMSSLSPSSARKDSPKRNRPRDSPTMANNTLSGGKKISPRTPYPEPPLVSREGGGRGPEPHGTHDSLPSRSNKAHPPELDDGGESGESGSKVPRLIRQPVASVIPKSPRTKTNKLVRAVKAVQQMDPAGVGVDDAATAADDAAGAGAGAESAGLAVDSILSLESSFSAKRKHRSTGNVSFKSKQTVSSLIDVLREPLPPPSAADVMHPAHAHVPADQSSNFSRAHRMYVVDTAFHHLDPNNNPVYHGWEKWVPVAKRSLWAGARVGSLIESKVRRGTSLLHSFSAGSQKNLL